MGNYGAEPVPDVDKIMQVAFGYRMAPQKKLKVDQHAVFGPVKAYHLVEKIGSTNLWVRVTPFTIPS